MVPSGRPFFRKRIKKEGLNVEIIGGRGSWRKSAFCT